MVESKELERFSRKGKVVSQEEDGNIAIELRRKRWKKGLKKPVCTTYFRLIMAQAEIKTVI